MEKPKFKINKIAIIGILIAVVIAVVLMAVAFNISVNVTQGHSLNIVNGMLKITKGQETPFGINVPSGATNIHIRGSFTNGITAAFNPGIIVYIFDENNYHLSQQSYSEDQKAPFSHFYSSYDDGGYFGSPHPIITSSFDVTLPSGGLYYLVIGYSNNNDQPSSQETQIKADLSYNG